LAALGAWALAAGACAKTAVDAPALAGPGPYGVGFASLTLVQPDQPDPLAWKPGQASLPTKPRVLPTDIWYPAIAVKAGRTVTYAGALTGEDGRPVRFTIQGVAMAGVRPERGRFPLVLMAHGYGGTPVAMRWLAENLASKGYVVAGPHFNDPPITDPKGFVGPLARRPLDIAFVLSELRQRAGVGALASADPGRVVLIGYSMGGQGVLTLAGAPLAPMLAPITHGALAPYVAGAPQAETLKAPSLKAVVAISPAGVFPGGEAWGKTGLEAITAPTLMIAGDQDHTVGYDPGIRTLWTQETHAPRWLLTFENAGHSLGMDAAPASMRSRLWDLDWFEDPVWRKDRMLAIELHFITAFLDLEVKGEANKADYLNAGDPVGDKAAWAPANGAPYGAASPGGAAGGWKGFQARRATGVELRYAPAAR
jgi:predicted dienelactone hydrolase